jgi:predicted nucleic acid-binding protein
MPFVVDASVALAWPFEDEASDYAVNVLRRLREDRGVVPPIWPLEVANGLLVGERRGRLSRAKAARAVELLCELPIVVDELDAETALGAVLDLARTHGLTAYDATYLELAMREGLPLATQDDALRSAAEQAGVDRID